MEIAFYIVFLGAFFTMFLMYLTTFVWNMFKGSKVDSIVDVIWGLNYVVYTVMFFVFSKGTYMDFAILFVMLLSGFRIFSTVLDKKIHNEFREDKRYTDMKSHFSSSWFNIRRFLQVYMLQMVIGAVLMLPVMYFLHFSFEIGTFESVLFRIGIFIIGIGLFIENLADLQLQEFRKYKLSKTNTVLKEGLFKYSRHPNYFGEALFWFGVCTICAIISPLSYISWGIIILLLLKVSGINTAEGQFKGSKEYEEYKKNTSSFIPWFPKNN